MLARHSLDRRMTLAPLSFLSAYDPPALMPAPWLVRIARFSTARCTHRWPAIRVDGRHRHWTAPVYEMRRDLGLPGGSNRLFGAASERRCAARACSPRLVGAPQPDWPANARTDRLRVLRSTRADAAIARAISSTRAIHRLSSRWGPLRSSIRARSSATAPRRPAARTARGPAGRPGSAVIIPQSDADLAVAAMRRSRSCFPAPRPSCIRAGSARPRRYYGPAARC